MQINYLWQLQHKPLGPATWSDKQPAAAPPTGTEEESETERILANATENEGRGPALGPDRFVDTVLKAYTTWLEREVVNGPIGRRAAQVIAQANGPSEAGRKSLAPTKVLVAAVLPPLVQDDTLPRIPQKYVERLEADHVSAQRAFERGERAPRSTTRLTPESIEATMAKTSLSDTPSPSPGPEGNGKMTVQELLKHEPALCTKPVRIAMTERFNSGLKAFCEQHPDVLGYVDIAEAMHDVDAEDAKVMAANSTAMPERLEREVDRATWACPVDPSNIHPLWEPTLPLWLKALKAHGVPTDSFAMSDDAEATFKAYEEDKRRRMNPLFADAPAPSQPVKLREE